MRVILTPIAIICKAVLGCLRKALIFRALQKGISYLTKDALLHDNMASFTR